MPLADYLAKNYLTASPAPGSSNKKRKRKAPKESSGLIIADDDALGWNAQPTEGDEEDGRPLTLGTGSAEFRKAKKNAWKTVGVPAPKDSEQDAADRIISQAAAENNAALQADEEPVIEAAEGVVKMGDGTHAGLQSGADVARQFEKRKREEKEAWERQQGSQGKVPEETVYRDATGRRIDISMQRAEAKKELEEKARLEREEKEMLKGDVQLAAKEKRKEDLDEARFMPFARKVDDEDLNQELKGRDRWNDPANQFVTKKEKEKSASGKPLYQGAAAPNRYGIRPGHRWDGVDRGNGWEGERFKALNRISRNKELEYNWQQDE